MSRVGTRLGLGQKVEIGRDLANIVNELVREYFQAR